MPHRQCHPPNGLHDLSTAKPHLPCVGSTLVWPQTTTDRNPSMHIWSPPFPQLVAPPCPVSPAPSPQHFVLFPQGAADRYREGLRHDDDPLDGDAVNRLRFSFHSKYKQVRWRRGITRGRLCSSALFPHHVGNLRRRRTRAPYVPITWFAPCCAEPAPLCIDACTPRVSTPPLQNAIGLPLHHHAQPMPRFDVPLSSVGVSRFHGGAGLPTRRQLRCCGYVPMTLNIVCVALNHLLCC